MKDFKTPFILMFMTFLASALLMFSQFKTKDKIEFQKKQKLISSLQVLIPDNLHDNDLAQSAFTIDANNSLNLRKPQLAYLGMLKQNITAIALPVTSHNGYSGDIEIMVGIKMDGEITSVKIINQQETPGLGDLILESKSDWILSLFGKSLNTPNAKNWKVKKDGGDFDQITGATISPRAVIEAVKRALEFHQENKQNYLSWVNSHE